MRVLFGLWWNVLAGIQKPYSTAFLWSNADDAGQQLAIAAGNCSHLNSASNVMRKNHANVAGGAIYATNKTTLNMTCDGDAPSLLRDGCSAWSDNTVLPAADCAHDPLPMILVSQHTQIFLCLC